MLVNHEFWAEEWSQNYEEEENLEAIGPLRKQRLVDTNPPESPLVARKPPRKQAVPVVKSPPGEPRAEMAPVKRSRLQQQCVNCSIQAVPLFVCGKCNDTIYCGADCQKSHWHKAHSAVCGTKMEINQRVL